MDLLSGIGGLVTGALVGGIAAPIIASAYGAPWWLQLPIALIGVPVGAQIGMAIDLATEGARFRR